MGPPPNPKYFRFAWRLLLLLIPLLPLSILFFRRPPPLAPKLLAPTLNCVTPVRLGDSYGGWVFCPPLFPSHLHDAIVYTIGIGRNIQWDVAMIGRYHTQHHGWDPTPTALDFVRKKSVPTNFHFHPIGLAVSDGNLTLKLPEGNHDSYTVMEFGKVAQNGTVLTVPVLSLRSMMQSLNHDTVAIVKIDIEGAEFDVIRKWKEEQYTAPTEQLLIEFHERYFQHRSDWTDMVPEAVKILEELGFDLITHTKLVSYFFFLLGHRTILRTRAM